MKIYGIILSVLGAASVALSTSCHGELDVTQSDKLNTTNMWTSESDALTATTGIYYRLRQAFAQSKANPFFWGELRVGPAMWGKGTGRSLCDNDMLDVMLNTLRPPMPRPTGAIFTPPSTSAIRCSNTLPESACPRTI